MTDQPRRNPFRAVRTNNNVVIDNFVYVTPPPSPPGKSIIPPSPKKRRNAKYEKYLLPFYATDDDIDAYYSRLATIAKEQNRLLLESANEITFIDEEKSVMIGWRAREQAAFPTFT